MVPAGSVLVFDVVGTTGGYLPIDDTDLRSGVNNQLTPLVDVLGNTITRGSTLSNILDLQWLHWNYTAQVTIKTRLVYGDADDIRSIIAGVFYNTAKAMPSVTIRTLNESQGPGVVTTGISSEALGELLASIREGSGLNDLSRGAQLVGLALIAGIIGIVYLVAHGPNVGAIARAVPRV